MLTNKLFIVAIVATSLLVGCASAPRPVFTEAQYTDFHKHYAAVSRCGTLGYLDPEIASLSLTYMKAELATYSYDPERMNAVFQRPVPAPTKEYCNFVAMKTHEHKRKIAINNEAVAADRQELQNILNNRPRQTYCNKIGTQTLCQTY